MTRLFVMAAFSHTKRPVTHARRSSLSPSSSCARSHALHRTLANPEDEVEKMKVKT